MMIYYLLTMYLTMFSFIWQKYLREALVEIARMHTSGKERNRWELKPEFKTAAGPAEGEPGDGEGGASGDAAGPGVKSEG